MAYRDDLMDLTKFILKKFGPDPCVQTNMVAQMLSFMLATFAADRRKPMSIQEATDLFSKCLRKVQKDSLSYYEGILKGMDGCDNAGVPSGGTQREAKHG